MAELKGKMAVAFKDHLDWEPDEFRVEFATSLTDDTPKWRDVKKMVSEDGKLSPGRCWLPSFFCKNDEASRHRSFPIIQ